MDLDLPMMQMLNLFNKKLKYINIINYRYR